MSDVLNDPLDPNAQDFARNTADVAGTIPTHEKKSWKKTILLVVIGIIITQQVFSLLLKVFLSPKGPFLTAKRNDTIKVLESEFEKIERDTHLSQTRTSSYDNCYSGQYNWKRVDDYRNRCEYQITRFYGFNGNLRDAIVDLDKNFDANEWIIDNSGFNLKSSLYDYDRFYGKTVPPYGLHNGGVFFASGLSGAKNGYTKNSVEVDDIRFAEKEGLVKVYLENIQGFSERGFPYYENKNFENLDSILNKTFTNYKYLVVVALQKEYFRR